MICLLVKLVVSVVLLVTLIIRSLILTSPSLMPTPKSILVSTGMVLLGLTVVSPHLLQY